VLICAAKYRGGERHEASNRRAQTGTDRPRLDRPGSGVRVPGSVFDVIAAVVGWVGGLYSSLPTTTFWLIHAASAGVGLVAFALFKVVLGRRMTTGTQEQAAALS